MLKKFEDLQRLKGSWLMVVLVFYLKKVFYLKPTKIENKIANFYYALVKNDFSIVNAFKNYVIIKNDSQNIVLALRNLPSSDIDVFYQIYVNKEYQPLIDISRKYFFNQKVSVVIDLGGNIGLTSLFLLSEYKKAKLFIVEPEKNNIEMINLNLKIHNNFDNQITISNAAVWSHDTKIKILSDFRDGADWAYRAVESCSDEGTLAYSLISYCKMHNIESIDILKIDIEGTEKIIFEGSDKDLDFLKCTKIIAIEIHEEVCKKNMIHDVLERYGFVVHDQGELTFGYNLNLIDSK